MRDEIRIAGLEEEIVSLRKQLNDQHDEYFDLAELYEMQVEAKYDARDKLERIADALAGPGTYEDVTRKIGEILDGS